MKSLSLILRIVAIVFGIAAVVLFFMTRGKLAEKQDSLQEAQATVQSLNGELETANDRVASLESQLKTERSDLADTKEQLDSVRSEMYTAKQEVTRTQQQLSSAKTQIEELEATATRLRSELVDAEQRIASASNEAELADLRSQVDELRETNQDLEDELAEAESRLEAHTAGDQATAEAGSAEASGRISFGTEICVASINSEGGVIVFNAKPGADLSVGNEFKMINELTPVGTARVAQVTPEYIVANVLPGANLRAVAVGDSVKIVR